MGRISINSEIQVISETVSQIGWFPYMEDETTLAVLFHDTDNWKNWKVTLDLENFSLSEPQIIQEDLDPPGGLAGRLEFAEFAFPDLDGSQYGSDADFYHVINASKYEATLNDQVLATVSRVFLDQRLGETREDMVLRELGYIPKDQYGTDTYFRDFFKIDWGDSYSFVDIVPLGLARLHALDNETVLLTAPTYGGYGVHIINKNDEAVLPDPTLTINFSLEDVLPVFYGDNKLLLLGTGMSGGKLSVQSFQINETSKRLQGLSADEELFGSFEYDEINAGAGDDTIWGLEGDDLLDGEAGNDTLDGGAGDDTLSGNAGSDTFVFKGEFGHDIITDYDSNDDQLEFYAGDGTELNISNLIETVNSDGNKVLSTNDGSASVTIEGVGNSLPTGSVTISGTAKQGATLTAVTSTISDEDGLGEFSYQWFSDDVLIVEASDSILKLSQSEVDKVIAVKVNYTDGYGKVEELMSSDSDAVVNVNDAPYGFVTISGTAIEGNTLTADTSRLSDKDGLGEFSYQWFADDVEIPNATESTFILNQSEVDKAITVKVSYIDGYGTAEEVASSASNMIATTITDRFGNAMTSAEAQAYEDSVNEITATSTTGNVTVFETASGTDLLIDAAMNIDTASDKAIGAFDALQALRLAVGLDKSDGSSEWHDYIAADINKDGRVGADDALNILKFAVGLTDGPSADWVFLDGDADYSAIDRKNTDYDEGILISDIMTDLSINMTGILVGDVDGSYLG